MNKFILREVGMIARSIQSICDIRYKEIGLEKGQFLFVVRILENPGLSQEALAELLKVDKTTVAKALKKLIEKGYVYKIRNEDDGRAYKLFPTTKAIEVSDFLNEVENDVNISALAGFDKITQDKLYKEMNQMRLQIEDIWNDVRKNRKK